MSKKFGLPSLVLMLALAGFAQPASAFWALVPAVMAGLGLSLGLAYDSQSDALEGESCSNYPVGPKCVSGLACVGDEQGYDLGFGVCKKSPNAKHGHRHRH